MILHGLHYSPWTERARWALDHAGLAYEYREHLLMLGEPALRLAARRLTGGVTVPLLVRPDGPPLMDSAAIARYAAARVPARGLFPPSHEAEIRTITDEVEAGLDAGRPAVLERILTNPASAAPSFIPGPLRASAVRMAMAYMRMSFGITAEGQAERRARVHAALETLRARLRNPGTSGDRAPRPHLCGDTLTFADLAAASLLQMVRPPNSLRMRDVYRTAFTDEGLAAEFADLLAWRDALYARHRPA